ncbi:MAG TPA: hypothetical protein ENF73_03165, partial [Proteobacteria bacterium]|nr:hypothetical protein [Pseudomonadota bacterium]
MGAKKLDLILVGPYPPPAGGIAYHVESLLKLVLRCGFNAVVLDINRNTTDRVSPVSGRAELFKRIARADAALVHIHADSFDLHYHAPVAAVAARLTGKKVILSIHSGDAADYYEAAPPLKKRLMRFSIKRADLIVADSQEIAEFAKRHGKEERVAVISPFLAGNPGFE